MAVGVHGTSFLSVQFPATVVQSSVSGFVIALPQIPMGLHAMSQMLSSAYSAMKKYVHVRCFFGTTQITYFQHHWRFFFNK